MSMISDPGVRPTWLVLLRGSIQPQWTRVSLWCHAERSAGSLSLGREMLRCPQHDTVPLSPPSLRSGQALSAAQGLSRWAGRCFAALSMTRFPCHPLHFVQGKL